MPDGPTYMKAIGSALTDAMEDSDELTLLGIDIARGGGVYGVTRGLHDQFGAARVRDTPIAEAGVVGAAVGAAMAGVPTVVEIMYMDFISVCLDPIINQAAKLRYMTGGGVEIPVVFRMQTGGGRSAGAQHSQSLEAILAHVPGLKVFCPGDARDAYDLLRAAIDDPNPVCFVENRRLYPVPDPEWERASLAPGTPRVVRPGNELTVITWGRMVRETLKALETVEGPGRDAEVIDVRTLVPLEIASIVQSVRRTGRCLIVHEAVEAFGAGAEIAARIADEVLYELDGPIARFGALPSPVPYSPALEKSMLPTHESIAARIREVAVA
jgi:pyruvate/2-oxoglutarate/acetoin dehydrogenase E1 component